MQELKNLPIWFLWRKEMDGDRINKVPFAAGGGATGTNDKYRHTWVTYEEAVAAAKMVGAAGVGFVIPEGYFFLDIDHADEDDPRVQTMLSRFDSYAEYSVSGNGLHTNTAGEDKDHVCFSDLCGMLFQTQLQMVGIADIVNRRFQR